MSSQNNPGPPPFRQIVENNFTVKHSVESVDVVRITTLVFVTLLVLKLAVFLVSALFALLVAFGASKGVSSYQTLRKSDDVFPSVFAEGLMSGKKPAAGSKGRNGGFYNE